MKLVLTAWYDLYYIVIINRRYYCFIYTTAKCSVDVGSACADCRMVYEMPAASLHFTLLQLCASMHIYWYPTYIQRDTAYT